MTPLKITAVATRQIEAGEAPTDLLPELTASTATSPWP